MATVSPMDRALNQARTLARARGLTKKPSSGFNQSREGPPSLTVVISTVWPFLRGVCKGTMAPSTRAPRQRWPSVVCTL